MTQPTHLAILGRQPELGLVELESILGSDNVQPFGKKASLISGEVQFEQLGGVIKVGHILYQGPVQDLLKVGLDMTALASSEEGKTTFGLSYYGVRATSRFVLAVGLELKKRLKQFGPVRLVSPQTGVELSAAQILHNKILADGFELLVVVEGQSMVVARTTRVQDIEAYAARDHGRPVRSATVGMLPPKLAQILINTTHAPLVVDPFCGTGVVLQEARLAGRAAYGSDLSPEMVAATRTNMDWLDGRTATALPAWQAHEADARAVMLPPGPLAVVSEGYLGPNLTHAPTTDHLTSLDAETSALYEATLRHWAAQLPAGTELALCIPNWRTARGWHVPAVVDAIPDLGYTFKVFKRAPARLRYARADQIVGRQLLLLTRT